MAEATEDHSNVLQQARELRLGGWIERIQRQARKSLTGQGVKAVKDISEKTISSLPALTRPTTYSNWEKQIFKLADSVRDGKQLMLLSYALAYIDYGTPLPQSFKTLPSAEFDMATATAADIKLREEFRREWLAFKESGLLEGSNPAKIETKPTTPSRGGSESEDPDTEDPFPPGSHVEALLEPSTKQKEKAAKEGSSTDAKWMPGQIID